MLDHPYGPFLGRVERPGRYVGGEFGAAVPPPEAEARIVLCFPDTYEVGMSHIGLAVLTEAVNATPGLSAERAFMPWPDMEAEIRRHGLALVSLESARPLAEFDVIGFSLQYELCYTNVIAMLDLARVPRRAEARAEGHPLVVAGGPVAAHAEPLAPFLDLALVGDGEEALPEMLLDLARGRREGASRRDLITRLSGRPGVFAPFRLEREPDACHGWTVVRSPPRGVVKAVRVPDLRGRPAGIGPVPAVSAVFDRFSVEVARGCAEGCRFCQAGFLYRPVRERDEDETSAIVRRAVRDLGHDEVSLASLSTADHSRLVQTVAALGDELTESRVSLAVPSLRAYGLPEETIEVLGRLRATGVTLAPEAGSQRLRDIVNKNVTEDEILAAAARFFDSGFDRVKLYFMIGLPGETDDDVRAIVDLSRRLRDLGRSRLGRPPRVVASVSTFVAKPFTPFEREAMIDAGEIRRRHALLQDLGLRSRVEVRLHDARLSRLEGLLCRGDVTLAGALERAVDLGARFDGWTEMFDEAAWEEALRGVDTRKLLAAVPDEARLPWDHVDVGVSPEFLSAERERARQGLTTPPCGRFAGEDGASRLVCHGCGVGCDPQRLPIRPLRPAIGPLTEARPARRPRPRPATSPGGDVASVRLRFAKWGRQAWVGHLDTMRLVSRCLRRAGLDVAYSEGFHPKPRIESGPPLPLGVAALDEPLDLRLVSPPEADEIIERLRRAVPPDLAFVAARRLAAGSPSIGRSLESASHVALVPIDPGEVLQGVSRLMESERIEVTRERRGQRSVVDVRPFVRDVRLLDERPAGLPLPESPGRSAIAIDLALPASGGARVREVLAAAVGAEAAAGSWIVRTRVRLLGDA